MDHYYAAQLHRAFCQNLMCHCRAWPASYSYTLGSSTGANLGAQVASVAARPVVLRLVM